MASSWKSNFLNYFNEFKIKTALRSLRFEKISLEKSILLFLSKSDSFIFKKQGTICEEFGNKKYREYERKIKEHINSEDKMKQSSVNILLGVSKTNYYKNEINPTLKPPHRKLFIDHETMIDLVIDSRMNRSLWIQNVVLIFSWII